MIETGGTTADIGVVVNGASTSTAAETLGQLLRDLGYGDSRIATAVNGEFVPADARAAQRLAAGDRIEIVAPRQGG